MPVPVPVLMFVPVLMTFAPAPVVVFPFVVIPVAATVPIPIAVPADHDAWSDVYRRRLINDGRRRVDRRRRDINRGGNADVDADVHVRRRRTGSADCQGAEDK